MTQELISQYRASLAMLKSAIERCPDELWEIPGQHNPFWRIVYHTLHYTNLYISEGLEEFRPWSKHISGYHQLGEPAITSKPYAKNELLAYQSQINASFSEKVREEDFKQPSGFEWLKMNKLELHLYNLRHLQHHTGQLIEQLHQKNIHGFKWLNGCS